MGSLAQAHNKAAIRAALRELGMANVAEIATATGLSRAVVRRWLGLMLAETTGVERVEGPGYPQYRLKEE